MGDRSRNSIAVGALLVFAIVGWVATRPRSGAPTLTVEHALNELDIDLVAGTPLPPLPTAQPDGMSIVTAEQALARGLEGMWGKPQPDTITVRLLNHGIMNRLCGDNGGSMPEDELVWAVAYTQPGLNMKDVSGPFFNRPPPFPWLRETSDASQPTPTPRPSPTPQPVAGMVVVFIAGQGFATYQSGLFDADSADTRCPTFAMIRALRSLPDWITPVPTVYYEPVNTMSVGELLIDEITVTNGISLPEMLDPAPPEPPTPAALLVP